MGIELGGNPGDQNGGESYGRLPYDGSCDAFAGNDSMRSMDFLPTNYAVPSDEVVSPVERHETLDDFIVQHDSAQPPVPPAEQAAVRDVFKSAVEAASLAHIAGIENVPGRVGEGDALTSVRLRAPIGEKDFYNVTVTAVDEPGKYTSSWPAEAGVRFYRQVTVTRMTYDYPVELRKWTEGLDGVVRRRDVMDLGSDRKDNTGMREHARDFRRSDNHALGRQVSDPSVDVSVAAPKPGENWKKGGATGTGPLEDLSVVMPEAVMQGQGMDLPDQPIGFSEMNGLTRLLVRCVPRPTEG